jgi:hypothetical protein
MELSSELHDPAALSPEIESHYPLYNRLGGLHTQSGLFVVEKNLFPLPEIEAWPSSPSLYRLRYFVTQK